MKVLNKGRKLLFLLLFGVLVLTMTGQTATAASTTNMVSYAKNHKVSKGKWVKNKFGIRYKKKDGTYLKNTWRSIGGYVYCFDNEGYVETKAFTYDGNHYYADSKGRVYVSKWRKTGKKTYYYGSNGVRAKGWKTIKGKCYYFSRTGEMAVSQWVCDSYVDKKGVRVANKTVNGRKINKSGEIQKASTKDKYIIIGASRIVDMSVAVNSTNTIFIAKNGMGYNWLVSTAGPKLKAYLKKNPNYKVMFQLGNNDTKNINAYIAYYKSLMKKYPDTEFYFMDATPATGSSASKNSARQKFNEKMKAAFGNLCVGGYDYMVSIKFSTVDGMHYPAEVSKKLYNYTIRAVEKVSASNASSISVDSIIEG